MPVNPFPARLVSGVRRSGPASLLVLCGLFSALLVSVVADEAEFPASGTLRYAGQVIDGDMDARGVPVEMGQPGDLAFGAGRLFVASGRGLSVFEPNRDTGELAFVYRADGYLTDASLAWDEKRSRVIAHNCGTWSAFHVSPGGAAAAPDSAGTLQPLAVVGDPAGCGQLLLDAEGDTAYRVTDSGVDAFVIREDGGLEFDSTVFVSDLKGAVVGESGRVYAATGQGLMAIGRDDWTGQLSAIPTGIALSSSSVRVPLAVDADRTRLLAVDSEGAHVFALNPLRAPVRLKRLPMAVVKQPDRNREISGCSFASIRSTFVVDVFCSSAVVTAPLPDEAVAFAGFERIGGEQTDRLSEAVPDFGEPVATASTPDGRHVYVSTLTDGLLLFEGLPSTDNVTDDHGDQTYSATRVTIPSTIDGHLGEGDTDLFRIDIEQAGTLRIESSGSVDTHGMLFSSRFTDIHTNDDGGVSSNFLIQTGRLNPGTYYVEVSGYSQYDTGAYRLSISGTARSVSSVQRPDLVVDSLTATDPAQDPDNVFTVSATVRNQGDGPAAATIVHFYRSTDPTIDDSDTFVGTDGVPALAAGGSNGQSILLGAPSEPGTYYFGACVNAVADESVSGNNCSTSVQIDVGGGGDGGGGGTGGGGREPSGDDHGNDRASASDVDIPSTTAGELEHGDKDFFRIHIASPGTLQVKTECRSRTPFDHCISTDTYGILYNGNGTEIARNDDGGTGRNFLIDAGTLSAGAYYLEVRGFQPSRTGLYELVVSGSARSTVQRNPDVVVESPAVSDATPAAGARITVSATVRNQGDAPAAATTLLYYRSADAAIATTDTRVGTDPVRALSAGAASDEAIALNVPVQSGTYYYGACVAAVVGEAVRDNNCSSGVRVEVPEGGVGGGTVGGGTGDDDHGNDRASATRVDIPSTTGGNLERRADLDYFRIEVGRAGTLRLESTGSTDTFATLYNSRGQEIADDDDNGAGRNFRITTGSLRVGAYYLEVRGFQTVITGPYLLMVSGSARGDTGSGTTAVASAPTVSINEIAAGDENTAVRLGATLTGGTYDGLPEYAWRVDDGALDDPTSASPTWTRPAMSAHANITVRLTVTVRGTGTNARSGSSDSATASRAGLVRNVSGAGSSSDDHGDIRDLATPVDIPSTTAGVLDRDDKDYFRIEVRSAGTLRLESSGGLDTYGTLYNRDGREVVRNDDSGAGRNFRIDSGRLSVGTYYLEVRGYAGHITGAYQVRVSGTARSGGGTALPLASAPAVAINPIAVGDENTAVRLGATLTGGIYDGPPEYAWQVDGGALDNPAAANPTWTRPAVTTNTHHSAHLNVTVRGTGTNARSGSSDAADDSRAALVRNTGSGAGGTGGGSSGDDHGNDRPSATAVDIPSTTAGELENDDKDYFRIDIGSAGTLQLKTECRSRTAFDHCISTDTYGTLYDGNGTEIRRNDDGGTGRNFLIDAGTLRAGAYYLEVRGFQPSSTGLYELIVSGSARSGGGGETTLAAIAPTVAINTIAPGNENTAVQLGATLTGGAYDGPPEYAWRVDGGTLDDPTSANPTWTRPAVTAHSNHAVRLSVTVRGTGGNARSGSSATGNASRSALVRDAGGGTVPVGDDHGDTRAAATVVALPSTTPGVLDRADRDYFRINLERAGTLLLETTGSVDTFGTLRNARGAEIDADDDNGVRRNFRIATDSLSAGAYYLEVRGYSDSHTGAYQLSASRGGGGGSSGGPNLTVESPGVTDAAPRQGGRFTLRATVRNRGNGSAAATTLRYFRSTDETISATDARVGTDAVRALGGGEDSAESIALTAPSQQGTYYYGACVDAVSGESARGDNCSLGVRVTVAANQGPLRAPIAEVETVADGNEGTSVRLVATVRGGSYDSIEYLWSARPQGGAFRRLPEGASPTWVRPHVAEDTNFEIRLEVLVRRGSEEPLRSTPSTAPTRVFDLGRVPAAAPSISIPIGATPKAGGSVEEYTPVLVGGAYDRVTWSWRETGGTGVTVLGDGALLYGHPLVTSDTQVTLTVAATFYGNGTIADAGTSATATASVTITVRRILSPASSDGFDVIYAGHQPEVHGGELRRLVLLQYPISGQFDTARFSWSVRGGGRIVPVPGRSLDDRIVAYQAPANVSSSFTARVACDVTLDGDGTTTLAGQPVTIPNFVELTVLPNRAAPVDDRRGPTTERGDEYADGYAFWNGGQAVQGTHNPYINTTPGRTITYSFPESPFTFDGRELDPLGRTSLPAFNRRYSTEGLRDGFRQALAHWEQYLNVRFREVADSTTANLLIGRDSDYTYATAFTLTDGDTSSQAIGVGLEYFDIGRNAENEAPLHEVGHALGLGHPHTQGAGANLDDAIMEYVAHDRVSLSRPGRLQFHADIIAAQHIWGAAAGAPHTAPDVPATVTLSYDQVADRLTATWTDVKINGGAEVTGWTVDWLLDSNPADTNSPLGGGAILRTDTLTDASARSASLSAPSSGNWSVQVRAVNAVGAGLRKRSPTTGAGVPVN